MLFRWMFGVFIFCVATGSLAQASTLKFAIVPKQMNAFFDEVAKGCFEAAATFGDVECIYKGPAQSDFRSQDKIISDLLDTGIDGLAVSVINSDHLVSNSLAKAVLMGIPVITFDSDLSLNNGQKPSAFRQGYVGTDNLMMGQVLAQELLNHREKGHFVIISGNASAPNLNERIDGIRHVLLNNKWIEVERSPIFVNDNTEHALNALKFFYQYKEKGIGALDAVISTSAALQLSDKAYRQITTDAESAPNGNNVRIISADTSPHQIRLLEDGLSHVNVGQNTFEMGALSIKLLHDLHAKKDIPEFSYTSLRVCHYNETPICQ